MITLGVAALLSACAPASTSSLPATPNREAAATQVALAPTPPTNSVGNGGEVAAATPTNEPTATLPPTASPTPTITPTPMPIATVNACAQIWQPGYYKLTNDVKTTALDCFIVQSHNVVLDCDNHSIEGKNFAGAGVAVRKFNFPILETPTNVEIKNCKIFYHKYGIFVNGGNNIYIHHNDLSLNFDDTNKQRYGIFLGLVDGGGLRFASVQNARVENNTTNLQAIGIDIRDSDRVTIRNNIADKNSAWGIALLNTSNSEITANTTRDNVRYCTWGDNKTVGRGCDAGGIMLQDGSSHNVIKDNQVTGENGNGIFIKAHAQRCGDDNLIQGNKIVDALYNAIEFSFCKDNKVIGNEISGSYDAVFFGFTTNTEIRGNLISNMRNHGIISWNSRNSTIAENQIANSREGVFFYWDTWDLKNYNFLAPSPDQYASRDNTIANNTFRENARAAIHLSNSFRNRVENNVFSYNAKDVLVEGKADGNIIPILTPAAAPTVPKP